MAATRRQRSTKLTGPASTSTATPVLYLALELGWNEWKLAFSTGPADRPRLRTLGGRKTTTLVEEIAKAKQRFGLPEGTPVLSCYEAGRDGFWLHRFLLAHDLANEIVDSSSIEVQRRGRRRKTDRLDAAKLVSMLIRWHHGEQHVWRVVQVPGVADEDRRRLHRDLLEMKAERTQHTNRIKGLLAGCGLAVAQVDADFPRVLVELRTWDGQPVPAELQQRLLRDYARWGFVDRQIKDLENERARRIRTATDEPIAKVRHLLNLRGIGANSAWLYVMECFGWRRLTNRKQVAALAGLTPTPYDSGDSSREQGISKAGNRRLRTMAVEIAWCWLHYQPGSALSQWFQQRFGSGNSRQRRIGIVALARKLLVALWRYLQTGEAPAGAEVLDWQTKKARSQAAALA
jgi:transposase